MCETDLEETRAGANVGARYSAFAVVGVLIHQRPQCVDMLSLALSRSAFFAGASESMRAWPLLTRVGRLVAMAFRESLNLYASGLDYAGPLGGFFAQVLAKLLG
jgi:hypothetical protein